MLGVFLGSEIVFFLFGELLLRDEDVLVWGNVLVVFVVLSV